MNGMNASFIDNPVVFLRSKCVDNSTMQQGIQAAKDISKLNQSKMGAFDLVPDGHNIVKLTYVGGGYRIKGDPPILAYWCPFLQGVGQPGFVDVPRAAPTYRFVLTAAMQGCAFAVTNSPAGAGSFRVHHNQHPENPSTWQAMHGSGANQQMSSFGYDQYGNGNLAQGSSNAFNLMWRPEGRAWSYVSQSNILVAGRKGFTVARDNGKPILDVPAGV